jgi:hypothetical protein
MRTKLNNGFEYEYEAQLGLPRPLPKNEEIIWQGSPNVWLVAKEIFYIRAVIFYFVALIAFQLIDGFQEGLSNKAISNFNHMDVGLKHLRHWPSCFFSDMYGKNNDLYDNESKGCYAYWDRFNDDI